MSKGKFMRIILLGTGICLALALVFLVFSAWCMESLPISKDEAKQITTGMSKDEVRNIIGSPYKTYTDNGSGEAWVYGHTFQWTGFYVDFDENGFVVDAYFDY